MSNQKHVKAKEEAENDEEGSLKVEIIDAAKHAQAQEQGNSKAHACVNHCFWEMLHQLEESDGTVQNVPEDK